MLLKFSFRVFFSLEMTQHQNGTGTFSVGRRNFPWATPAFQHLGGIGGCLPWAACANPVFSPCLLLRPQVYHFWQHRAVPAEHRELGLFLPAWDTGGRGFSGNCKHPVQWKITGSGAYDFHTGQLLFSLVETSRCSLVLIDSLSFSSTFPEIFFLEVLFLAFKTSPQLPGS